MMFRFKRNRKQASVTEPGVTWVTADVVARAEQILDDALIDMLFEAIEMCLRLRENPRISPLLAVKIDAALDNAADVLAGIGSAA